jgi:hypothetical protein
MRPVVPPWTVALTLIVQPASAQIQPDPTAHYLFYLHGRIVEEQGAGARHPEFGAYEYGAIIRTFKDSGFVVVSEMRRPNTDVSSYADSVAGQVRRLIAGGVPGSHITVVGASKGAGLAMLVSDRLTQSIRYVMLAGCSENVPGNRAPKLHGDVLSIYEESDSLGRSCGRIFARSPDLATSGEIRLQTGLKHGFIYRPLAAWLGPAMAWARK